tara:strand:- start:2055 stop:2324 length:270 start_codon:yes stop_codon:yes gene_type:complete
MKNPELEEKVEPTDSDLKKMIVDYVGSRLLGNLGSPGEPEDVTVDMAVQVFAAEFPEFLMAVAGENFLRGYEQALVDVENSMDERKKSG